MSAPTVHRYGGGEFMLGWGEGSGPQLLVLQPLFEEMNRCRWLVAAVCRRLAEAGARCWLPDLPGTGESLTALENVGWGDWLGAVDAAAAAVRSATGAAPLIVALRGGALLDQRLPGPHWRLAPTSGRSLLSDLRRSALAGGGDRENPAGYRLSPDLTAALETAVAAPLEACRTVRLVFDAKAADARLDFAPLWRRPEPAADAAAALVVAHDILAWASR